MMLFKSFSHPFSVIHLLFQGSFAAMLYINYIVEYVKRQKCDEDEQFKHENNDNNMIHDFRISYIIWIKLSS
jgi:hypothetical protein